MTDDLISRRSAIDALGERPLVWDEYTDEYELGQRNQYDSDKAAIETVPSAPRWIPCKERLPKNTDPVNITWVNRKPEPYYSDIKNKPFTATGHYCKGRWWWYSSVCQDYLDEYGENEMDKIDEDIEVLAWMPLPKPYKEGE